MWSYEIEQTSEQNTISKDGPSLFKSCANRFMNASNLVSFTTCHLILEYNALLWDPHTSGITLISLKMVQRNVLRFDGYTPSSPQLHLVFPNFLIALLDEEILLS